MSRWIDGEWLLNFFEPYPDNYQTPLGTLRACVDDAPSIDIEPKRGKWIKISSPYSLDRTYKCSVCGKVIDDMPMDEYYDPAYKGCPYCLARMKGADDADR